MSLRMGRSGLCTRERLPAARLEMPAPTVMILREVGWAEDVGRSLSARARLGNIPENANKECRECIEQSQEALERRSQMYEAIAPRRLTGPSRIPAMSARGRQENSLLQSVHTPHRCQLIEPCITKHPHLAFQSRFALFLLKSYPISYIPSYPSRGAIWGAQSQSAFPCCSALGLPGHIQP